MKCYEIINEARLSDFSYTDEPGQASVSLKSYQSQIYTKLGQKLKRIEELEQELDELKEQVKQSTREDVAALFDVEDAVKTRVVETVSFIFTLSKDPKATVSPKYKEILETLAEQLTPELIQVLEGLKKTMVTVRQKEPSLRYKSKQTKLDEGMFTNYLRKLKHWVNSWGKKYDAKLNQLKSLAS